MLPKFNLWISKKEKNNLRDELPNVIKVTLKCYEKERGGGQKLLHSVQTRHAQMHVSEFGAKHE